MQTTTDVIFRAWPTGEIIALFPGVAGTNDPATCQSYMRVGQHGSADPAAVMKATRHCNTKASADLSRELAGIGYNLRVIRRCDRAHYAERQRQCGRPMATT